MFAACHMLLAGSLLDLLIDPEDGGSIFPQSVGEPSTRPHGIIS
jgi:hypothetical protein